MSNNRKTSTPNRPPRGFTPTKSKNPSSLVQRMSSYTIPNLENLSLEEELLILERMERGDYIRGAGWNQFLSPALQAQQPPAITNANNPNVNANNTAPTTKSKCQQNLADAFSSAEVTRSFVTSTPAPRSANVDDSRPPMGFFGDGFEGGLTMNNGNHNQNITALAEVADVDRLEDGTLDLSKYDYMLPEYLKKMDAVMQAVDDYKRLISSAVDAVVEAEYHEYFPQSKVNILREMDQSMELLDKFRKPSSNLRSMVFSPNPEPGSRIPCPLGKEKQFVDAVNNISEILTKVNRALSDPKKDLKLTERIHAFVEQVKALESDFRIQEIELESITEQLTSMNVKESDIDVDAGSVEGDEIGNFFVGSCDTSGTDSANTTG